MQEIDVLRATAHPLRLQMLSLLTGEAMSASDIARALDISQANASYHLRVLHRSGLIHVTDEVKIRGGVARRYRHESSNIPITVQEDDGANTLSRSPYHEFVSALSAELQRRTTLRSDGGPQLTTDADLWIDPALWHEIVTTVGRASARLHAAARPAGEHGTIHVSMTAALFRMTGAVETGGT